MKSVKLKLLISLNPKEMISIAIVYTFFLHKSSVRCRFSAVQALVLISICSCYESVLPLYCINLELNIQYHSHWWMLGYA